MALTVGPDGRVWTGSWSRGVAVRDGGGWLDGRDWTTHSHTDHATMARTSRTDFPGGSVYAVAVADDGTVWAGSEGSGVAAFDGEQWTSHTLQDGLASNQVSSLATGPEGTVWAGTFPVHDDMVIEDAAGGLSAFDGEQWASYSAEDGLADNEVRSVAVTDDGTVWAATADGVSRFDGDAWATFTTEDGLADNDVWSVAVTDDGRVLAGTYGEVSVFDGETWRGYRDGDAAAAVTEPGRLGDGEDTEDTGDAEDRDGTGPEGEGESAGPEAPELGPEDAHRRAPERLMQPAAELRAAAEAGHLPKGYEDAWNEFGPSSKFDERGSLSWSNKDELWNEAVTTVWQDAVERFGHDAIHDRQMTVWGGRAGHTVRIFGSQSDNDIATLVIFQLALADRTMSDRDASDAGASRAEPGDEVALWLVAIVSDDPEATQQHGEIVAVYEPLVVDAKASYHQDVVAKISRHAEQANGLREKDDPPRVDG